VNEAFIAAAAVLSSALISAGILIAVVKFQGKRQDEDRRAAKADANGIGKIARSIMAEQIIDGAVIAGMPKDAVPEFAVKVRKLLCGI
jgi:hypothetical protein